MVLHDRVSPPKYAVKLDRTYVPGEIFEHVGLQGHVNVDGSGHVAEFAVFDFEEAVDVFGWSGYA